jgi:signal recognition particle GTPase
MKASLFSHDSNFIRRHEQEPNLLERLKAGIQKTRAGLMDRLEDAVAGRKEIDADLLDEVEYALITADIGVNTTAEILENIRQRADRKQLATRAKSSSSSRSICWKCWKPPTARCRTWPNLRPW